MIGILNITSKIIYGFNAKKSQLYLFVPLNKKNSKYYVPFNIRTKTNKYYKSLSRDIYVLINHNKYDEHKYPIGNLVEILGCIGDLQIEYNVILHKYGLHYKNPDKITEFMHNDQSDEHDDLTNLDVISIDPLGCNDIDDAVHYRKYNDEIEVGIHIADVTYYLDKFVHIDTAAKQRLSTIYMPNKQINMLPNMISTDLCSLHPLVNKFAVSIIIKLSQDYVVKGYRIVRSVINSRKAYVYDEIENILEGKQQNEYNVIELYECACGIMQDMKLNIGSIDKAHKLIEVFMVLANYLVACELCARFNYPLLRNHSNVDNVPQEIIDANIGFLNYMSALYTTDKSNTYHSGLDVEKYTHFTSPIRRYADIVVHRMLLNNWSETSEQIKELNELCDKMNELGKKLNKANRDFEKLKLIDLLGNCEGSEITNAYVIDIDETELILWLYLPKYKLSHSSKLFSKKIKHLLDIEYKNHVLRIHNKETDNRLMFSLYDKINVSLITYPNEKQFNKKLLIYCH